jgi:Fe-S-cluster-containing hydrogenase component 2
VASYVISGSRSDNANSSFEDTAMTEDLYRKLQRHLDRMPVGFPSSKSGVEIKILQQLFTPEDAAVALELSALPEPAKVIHVRLKSKMTLPELTEKLDQMSGKGIIHRLPIAAEPLYGKMIFAVGMYEHQVHRLTAEFERDSQQYLEEAFGEAFHSKKTTQMRIVPVDLDIPVERNVTSYDDLRAYVESISGPFARMTCICRHGKELLGHKCKQTSLLDNCLTFGLGAKLMVEQGAARLISREEMLELVNAADKEGLVLQPENTKSPLFVCCCCGCCCNVLTSAKRFPRPAEYFSSNAYAEVDREACGACGLCEARCQMDAISMKDGKADVDCSRCIGCALCVTTCPSGALRLQTKSSGKVLPDDTQALYGRLLLERYGPWGMAKIAARKLLGKKF